jgi:dihydropyrimidinase
MDAFDLLVVNGLVVTASDTANYDIAIKDGKIALLAPPGVLKVESAKKVIDAEGGYVMVRRSCQSFLSSSSSIPES